MDSLKKEKKHNINKVNSLFLGFLGGLASCTAEFITFPLDNIKTRFQMNGKQGMPVYASLQDCVSRTWKDTGVKGFYKGASAAFGRQITYSTARMWAFEKINRLFSSDVSQVGFFRKLFSGGLGGAIGCLVGTPFDIFKIRLINDMMGLKYKGLIDCAKQTIETDGFLGFYRGIGVNIARAIVVNAAELATYDRAKHQITVSLQMDERSVFTHFLSSVCSGFAAAVASSPVDVVKTRYMNQMKGGVVEYSSAVDCALKIFKNEGFKSFYKGFIPLWARIGPWNLVFFITYEKLKINVVPLVY